MNADKQQRLRELALIMLRDAHGEDFTAEQAAELPAQIEEYRRLTEPQEILSLLGILGHGQGDEGLITEKQIQDLEDADEYSLRHYSSEVSLLIDSYRKLLQDKARLDWFDRISAALNLRYGAEYRWQVVTNHNVNRLVLGHMVVDLCDHHPNGLPSCRDAIDAARNRGGRANG